MLIGIIIGRENIILNEKLTKENVESQVKYHMEMLYKCYREEDYLGTITHSELISKLTYLLQVNTNTEILKEENE